MTDMVGRQLLVKSGSTLLAGIRSRGITVNKEALDISSGEADGYQTFSSTNVSSKSLEIPCDGIMVDDELLNSAMAGDTPSVLTLTFEFPVFSGGETGATITGSFIMDSFQVTGEDNGEVTFSTTFKSSGEWVFTPES